MNRVSVEEAKAKLSGIVSAAENGEPTIVTRYSVPVAVVVPIEQGRQLYPDAKPGFADWLLSMPAGIPVKRSRSRPRKVKF
jgi:prevent-host-death family protein